MLGLCLIKQFCIFLFLRQRLTKLSATPIGRISNFSHTVSLLPCVPNVSNSPDSRKVLSSLQFAKSPVSDVSTHTLKYRKRRKVGKYRNGSFQERSTLPHRGNFCRPDEEGRNVLRIIAYRGWTLEGAPPPIKIAYAVFCHHK